LTSPVRRCTRIDHERRVHVSEVHAGARDSRQPTP
jgi:hypothetical protein